MIDGARKKKFFTPCIALIFCSEVLVYFLPVFRYVLYYYDRFVFSNLIRASLNALLCSTGRSGGEYGNMGPIKGKTHCFKKAVLRIQIRIRIPLFLGLLNPDQYPLVRSMDPDPGLDHQAKISLSSNNDVNVVPSNSNKLIFFNLVFFCVLKVNDENSRIRTRIQIWIH